MKPKRRLFELLKSQGMQNNQQIIFLSEGGETVRNLQLYLHPSAEARPMPTILLELLFSELLQKEQS